MVEATAFQRKRNWLLVTAVLVVVLGVLCVAAGHIYSRTERVAPEVDYTGILAVELARDHYETTGSSTVVFKNEETREFFENEYNSS